MDEGTVSAEALTSAIIYLGRLRMAVEDLGTDGQ